MDQYLERFLSRCSVPEIGLWVSVLWTAKNDIRYYYAARRRRNAKGGRHVHLTTKELEYMESVEWLKRRSRDYRHVCELACIDPDFFAQLVDREIQIYE